jgi:hypothetical protein
MAYYMNPQHGRHVTGKISKYEAQYETHASGKDQCRDCTHFDAPNGCTKVQGDINAGGWCKLFERTR